MSTSHPEDASSDKLSQQGVIRDIAARYGHKIIEEFQQAFGFGMLLQKGFSD